jgi:hypothetical protein
LILSFNGFSLTEVRLYRSRDLPGRWIGEDKHGGLVHWPAEPGGWEQRTPYTGPKRVLEECEPTLARGTGWPGGGRGRPARSGAAATTFGVRATTDEIAAWKERAKEEHKKPTVWARDELNAAVTRPRSKGKP